MYSQPEPNERQFDSPKEYGEDIDFDDPTAMDKAKEYAEDAQKILKEHWQKIAIAIVVLVVAFFVFDFFFASVKTVNFSVTDTEGNPLSGAGIKIFDATGKEIKKISASQTITLQRGTYSASITLTGYKQKSSVQVIVEENPTIIEIELEKNWDLEIRVDDFPPKLVEGQKSGFYLTIQNNKDEQQQINLIFTGSLDNRYMSINYPSPHTATPGETRVFLEMNVKENLKTSLIKNGLSGTIRVRGLNNSKAKKSVGFDLAEFDSKKLRVTGSASFGKVTEGHTKGPKDISIENKLDYPIENVELFVEINSTQFSNASEVEQWFSFNREVPIDKIPAGERIRVGLIAAVPIGIPFSQGAEREIVSGKLFIRTSFWEKEIDLDLTAEKSEVKLSISGINQTIRINFDSDSGGYPVKPGILKLKNQGELPIKTVNLSYTCTSTVHWNYPNTITFDQTLFNEISVDQEKETPYKIKIPSNANSGDIVTCKLSVGYNDPRNPTGDRLYSEESFILEIQ